MLHRVVMLTLFALLALCIGDAFRGGRYRQPAAPATQPAQPPAAGSPAAPPAARSRPRPRRRRRRPSRPRGASPSTHRPRKCHRPGDRAARRAALTRRATRARRGWPRPTRWRSMRESRFSARAARRSMPRSPCRRCSGSSSRRAPAIGGGAFLLYYDAQHRQGQRASTAARTPRRARPPTCSSMSTASRCLPRGGAQRALHRRAGRDRHALRRAGQGCGALRWKELFRARRSAPPPRASTCRRAWRCSSARARRSRRPTRCATLFSRPDGETLQEGDMFRNPEYAQDPASASRTRVPRALYEGLIAAEIVNAIAPGAAARHHDAEGSGRLPHRAGQSRCAARIRSYTVCVPPPPSSGVSLLELLGDARPHRHRQPRPERPAGLVPVRAGEPPHVRRPRPLRRRPAASSPCRSSACSIRPTSSCARSSSASARARRRRRATSRRAARPRRHQRVRRHQPLRGRGCRRQCRLDDDHGGVGVRLRAHRRRLRAQQPAHRFLLRADARTAIRSPTPCRAASGRAPRWRRHRARSRRQLRGGARLPGRLGDPRVQRQDAGGAARLEAADQAGDRAAEPHRARRRPSAASSSRFSPDGARRAARARHRAQARTRGELGPARAAAPSRRHLRGRGGLAPRGRGAHAAAPKMPAAAQHAAARARPSGACPASGSRGRPRRSSASTG